MLWLNIFSFFVLPTSILLWPIQSNPEVKKSCELKMCTERSQEKKIWKIYHPEHSLPIVWIRNLICLELQKVLRYQIELSWNTCQSEDNNCLCPAPLPTEERDWWDKRWGNNKGAHADNVPYFSRRRGGGKTGSNCMASSYGKGKKWMEIFFKYLALWMPEVVLFTFNL